MKRTVQIPKTTITANKPVEGETIEAKVRRITTNGEPINETARLIYTDYKDGVVKDYDIRTDRMYEAMMINNERDRATTAKIKDAILSEAKAKEEKLKNAETADKGTAETE